MDLKRELSDLAQLNNPSRRGKGFEIFLARLLESSGFRVTFNAQSASPRQTDLMAQNEETFFIAEAKWTRKKSGIEDISSVRNRLSRVSPGVFACLFSMAGFSDGAIDDVRQRRNQEIVLFNGNEIRSIVVGHVSFKDLLDEKRKHLRTNAIVAMFDDPITTPYTGHLKNEPDIFQIAGKQTSWLRADTKGHDVIFSNELLNFVGRNGSLASLALVLQIQEVADLERVLLLSKETFCLSGLGSFVINQSTASWFGFGLQGFFSAVKMQHKRYEDLNWGSYHHSEELAYIDHLESGGMICFSSRQSVGKGNMVHSSGVELYLPGVPVDMGKLRHFCKITKNVDASIETIMENPIQSVRLQPGQAVEPVGQIISNSTSDPFVSGLVIRNPFRNSPLPANDEEPIDQLQMMIRECEYLVCSLRSWYKPTSILQDYKIFEIEGSWIGHRYAVNIICDWV